MSQTHGTPTQLDVIRPLIGRYLTLEEVADRLGFTVDQARRRARRDQLPGARKLGKSWRVHAAPFEAWANDWWDGQGSFDTWLLTAQPAVAGE